MNPQVVASANSRIDGPRAAPTSRLGGLPRSQDGPRIGRGDKDVARVRGAHVRDYVCASGGISAIGSVLPDLAGCI